MDAAIDRGSSRKKWMGATIDMNDVYRAIFTADLHISNRLPFSKPMADGVTDRLQDVCRVIKRIIHAAKKASAEAIFILGDTFDKSLVDAITLTHTMKAIVETTVPMYILAGNHDANSIRGGRFVVEAFGAMDHHYIHYLNGILSPRPWLNFIPVPFMVVSEAASRICLEKKNLNKELVNVLLFHNSVLGCNHMEWTCDDGLEPKLLTTGFDYAFGGHFHTHQTFGKKQNGMYVGAPLHHHFGDMGRDAGFWVVDFEKSGDISCKFISGGAPDFHVTKKLKRDDVWKNGDYIRVEVEATYPDWINLKSRVSAFCESLNGMNVTFKHKPIYHHTKRLTDANGMAGKLTLDAALDEYLKTPGVITGDLDAKRLKSVGEEILQGVRGEYGIV
jgi:DNA repair exonuclease SbcCD nuclease subunit